MKNVGKFFLAAGFPARASYKRKRTSDRRGKRAYGLLAASVPVIAGFTAATVIGQMAIGERAVAVVAKAARDPGALLANRSPGERAPGALMGKGRQALASPALRGLPPEFTQPSPALGAPVDPVALFAMPDTPPPAVVEAGAPQPVSDAILPVGPVHFSPFIPVASGGGASDPGEPGPGPGEPNEPGPGPGPIPEPATWAMLISGFFAMGWMLRRSARVSAPAH